MADTDMPRTRVIAEIQEATLTAATPEVIVLPTLSDAAHRACQDTVQILVAVVMDRGVAHLALTGGSGGMTLSEVLVPSIAAQPEEVHHAIHLWFGDGRFVPAGDPEHGDLLTTPLITASIGESRTHWLAALNEVGDLDETTARMAHGLMSAGMVHGGFDVIHVGLGPDACARSLFPGYPTALAVEAPIVAVHDSSEPPPERYSLTFDTLQHAGRIMMVAGGEGEAEVVRLELGAFDVLKAPASCYRGKQATQHLDEQVGALMTD